MLGIRSKQNQLAVPAGAAARPTTGPIEKGAAEAKARKFHAGSQITMLL
jgi:hypothetical protein